MFLKYKNQLKQLGPIALGTYTGISCISCMSWATIFAVGIDIKPVTSIMKNVTIPYLDPEWSSYLGLVWAAHTAIFPVRFGLTVGLTPLVKRILIKKNIIKQL
jgi:hypothetical protein